MPPPHGTIVWARVLAWEALNKTGSNHLNWYIDLMVLEVSGTSAFLSWINFTASVPHRQHLNIDINSSLRPTCYLGGGLYVDIHAFPRYTL